MSAVGGRPREIRLPTESSIQGQYSLPQWSTDGSEIAVAVRRLTGKAIAIVSLESLETRHVSIPPQEGPFSADLSWSPDGQTFAYVDSAGGEMTQLTTDPTPDWTPRWSPDGTEIAFHAYRSGNREIWVMPSDGGPARQLTAHPTADIVPTWSSDGREIAFISDRGGVRSLWIVDAGGGEPRRWLQAVVTQNGPPMEARSSSRGTVRSGECLRQAVRRSASARVRVWCPSGPRTASCCITWDRSSILAGCGPCPHRMGKRSSLRI